MKKRHIALVLVGTLITLNLTPACDRSTTECTIPVQNATNDAINFAIVLQNGGSFGASIPKNSTATIPMINRGSYIKYIRVYKEKDGTLYSDTVFDNQDTLNREGSALPNQYVHVYPDIYGMRSFKIQTPGFHLTKTKNFTIKGVLNGKEVKITP